MLFSTLYLQQKWSVFYFFSVIAIICCVCYSSIKWYLGFWIVFFPYPAIILCTFCIWASYHKDKSILKVFLPHALCCLFDFTKLYLTTQKFLISEKQFKHFFPLLLVLWYDVWNNFNFKIPWWHFHWRYLKKYWIIPWATAVILDYGVGWESIFFIWTSH